MKTIHKAAAAVAVMATETTIDSATSFAHSQYDTNAISGWPSCHASSLPGNLGKRQSGLCQSELDARLRRTSFLKLQSVPSRSHTVDHRFCLWQGNWKWSAGAARFKSTGGPTLWFQSLAKFKPAVGRFEVTLC